MPQRIFLLSPASSAGRRARILLREGAAFDLALRLRSCPGVPLDEVFTFLSGLYFRGKLTYARRFASPPAGLPGVFVITPNAGLWPAEKTVTAAHLRRFAKVQVDAKEPRYTAPLSRDARGLLQLAGPEAEIVLLGSIASGKYRDVLLPVFGDRLLYPLEFVGRGDMSRGGLLLRHAREDRELAYGPVAAGPRKGPRPPKLPPLRREPP